MAYGSEDCGYGKPEEAIIYPKNQDLNCYLIRTTTEDEWELAQGIYIVCAKNIQSAMKILRKKTAEIVLDTKLLKLKKEGIIKVGYKITKINGKRNFGSST